MRLRNSLAVVALLAASAQGQTRDISADSYYDKLGGMWLGEIVGVRAAAPREGAIDRGGNTYAINWPTLLATNPWPGDDDTSVEYLYSTVLSVNPSPSGADLRQAWKDHINANDYYIANRHARWLMDSGLTPPQTGSATWNVQFYAIDAQITTESVGSASPGMRQNAADLTSRLASVSNEGYSVHAAQYYAAMYSSAAFDSDVSSLVAKGVAVVPRTSRTYQVIQDVRDWYAADLADGSADWRSTQQKIYDKYYLGDFGRYRGWVESTVNTGLTTMALLYGRGDFQQTVQIAAQGGFDADCNSATAAGLVGMTLGRTALTAALGTAPSDAYHVTNLIGMPDTTISAMARNWQQAAELQIPLAGGTITGSGSIRVYHMPADDTLRPLVERPDPAGPKGLVASVRNAGGAVTTTASLNYHHASVDRENLDSIIDGITDVTFNGHVPYTTRDWIVTPPAGGDFYQINFGRSVTFGSVIFYEGEVFLNGANVDPRAPGGLLGGFFTDLTVEVRQSGTFVPVSALHFSEPLDAYKFYQQIELFFDPISGDAVRIRGTSGGTEPCTTIVELEAYAPYGPGDMNRDGGVDVADYTAWFNHYGMQYPKLADGDANHDGLVDVADYTMWFNNYGGGGSAPVPEPATLSVLAMASLLLTRRRLGKPCHPR